jgi:putative ABC transport system substrate-binding protein
MVGPWSPGRQCDGASSLLVGAAAWPRSGHAQQPDRIRRVGFLIASAEDDPESKPRLAAFRQGLEKLGWSEGRNIHLDVRFAVPTMSLPTR